MLKQYAAASERLLVDQRHEWPMCSKGYSTLTGVITRTFEYDGFHLSVQFNPGRMTSTSAKVDKDSIASRKCFLCIENLPPEQRSLSFSDDFHILVNPFPIFPEHFTLPSKKHVPQEIASSFPVMLDFARELSDRYTVFYNGPRCGASAPDHLHFQAGTRNFMTIERDLQNLISTYGVVLLSAETMKLTAVDDGMRKMMVLQSGDKEATNSTFQKLLSVLQNDTEEPMLNILAWYELDVWNVVVFLRKKHRPECYFAEGDERIMLSPASVDIGGVGVIPVEDDFKRITADTLADILQEVFVSKEELETVSSRLKNLL